MLAYFYLYPHSFKALDSNLEAYRHPSVEYQIYKRVKTNIKEEEYSDEYFKKNEIRISH